MIFACASWREYPETVIQSLAVQCRQLGHVDYRRPREIGFSLSEGRTLPGIRAKVAGSMLIAATTVVWDRASR